MPDSVMKCRQLSKALKRNIRGVGKKNRTKNKTKKSHKTPKPTTNAEPNQGARSKATTPRASGTLPLRGAAGSALRAGQGQGQGRGSAPRAELGQRPPDRSRDEPGAVQLPRRISPARGGQVNSRTAPLPPRGTGQSQLGSAQQPGKVGREQHARGPGQAASPRPGQRPLPPPPAPGLPLAAPLTTRLRRRRTPPAAGPGSGPALPRGSW